MNSSRAALVGMIGRSAILQALLIGAGYYALTRAGRLLELPPTQIAVFWPAAGLGLVGFLLTERRSWPAISAALVIANLAGNLNAGQNIRASAIFAAANLLEPLIGALALRQMLGRGPRLDGPRELAAFVVVGTVANSMLAALLGATGAVAYAGASEFLDTWRQWWVADANGILVVAPFVLAWVGSNWRIPMRLREIAALSVASTAVTIVFFALDTTESPAIAIYGILPIVLLGALRGGVFGVGMTFSPAAVIAVAVTAHDRGPFAAIAGLPAEAALDVQLFLGSLGLAALFVAIVPSAHSRTDQARALHEQQRTIASTLQQSLLSGDLPDVPGTRLRGSYRAGAAGLNVGGDWYDAFMLPSGRVALVVGDVVGHGLAASSTMGRLRSALRALAALDAGPAILLERLDRFAQDDDDARMATVLYAELDARTGELDYACAGHPPPVLFDGSGARLLNGGRSTPLAAGGPITRPEARVTIPPESTLVLYTDGLVERRGESITTGLARLCRRVDVIARSPDLDALVDAMHADAPQRDDVCVLAITRTATTEGALAVTFPSRSEQLAPARDALRRWLADQDLDGRTVDDLVLAAGEACSNAVEHAYLPDTDGSIDLRATRRDDGAIVITIRDRGRWRHPPQLPATGRGRGLPIIARLSDDLHVDAAHDGTTVTITRRSSDHARS